MKGLTGLIRQEIEADTVRKQTGEIGDDDRKDRRCREQEMQRTKNTEDRKCERRGTRLMVEAENANMRWENSAKRERIGARWQRRRDRRQKEKRGESWGRPCCHLPRQPPERARLEGGRVAWQQRLGQARGCCFFSLPSGSWPRPASREGPCGHWHPWCRDKEPACRS